MRISNNHNSRFIRVAFAFLLAILFVAPIAVGAQVGVIGSTYNAGYITTNVDPGGVIPGVPAPVPAGIPGNTGIVGQTGTVPALTVTSLFPNKITTHLLINQSGIGDNCSAGLSQIVPWSLDPTKTIETKDDLLAVIALAQKSDQRLRQVNVVDDQIDMYYLQPAYRYGFIPENYYLHIGVSGSTYRISLDKPTWVGSATNSHALVTAAFETQVPQILGTATVTELNTLNLAARDAVMMEIVSSIMRQVPVEPISNSFFVCYIVPFLVYILLIIAIAAVFLWFFIRKLRRTSGFKINKVSSRQYGNEREDEENDSEPEVMHFRPKARRPDEESDTDDEKEANPEGK